MKPQIAVKICGVKTLADIDAVNATGVFYVGLNFYPGSPRVLSPQIARSLALACHPNIKKVGLVVDMDDAQLAQIIDTVPIDYIQLHGQEVPARVKDIRARFGLPVIKAIGLSEESDLAEIDLFEDVADQILVDARPPKGSTLPGGNGVAFDWRLLSNRTFWKCPWLLAGGLTPQNVSEAIEKTGACQVDVSSGVEHSVGQKDPALIRDFVANARSSQPSAVS